MINIALKSYKDEKNSQVTSIKGRANEVYYKEKLAEPNSRGYKIKPRLDNKNQKSSPNKITVITL